MKRVLASLVLGLIIAPMFFGPLLIAKIINPNEYDGFLWMVIWPLPLMSRLPWFTPSAGRVLLAGIFGDYLLLSFLAHCCLTVGSRLRKRRVQTPPPLPIQFE